MHAGAFFVAALRRTASMPSSGLNAMPEIILHGNRGLLGSDSVHFCQLADGVVYLTLAQVITMWDQESCLSAP